MRIQIDDLVFDRAKYDAEGDVISVTIINAKWLLDRDGYLKITLPHEVRVQPDELAPALS